MAQEKMGKIMKYLDGQYKTMANQLQQVIEKNIMKCFSQSGNNLSRFVDCASNNQKKIVQLTEVNQLKSQFLQLSIGQCLYKGQSQQTCQSEAQHIISQIKNDFKQQLDNI